MNQIAQKLKEKNIAEYLIYMWQEEDLIRANHCEMEEMEANVIARYPEDQRPAMREWYGNLITMMSEEGVREKGHLQINKNIIINLTAVSYTHLRPKMHRNALGQKSVTSLKDIKCVSRNR